MRLSLLKYTAIVIAVIFFYPLTAFPARKEKIKVRDVRFENNEAFRTKTLQRLMLNRPSSLFLPVTYNNSLLNEDIEQIELYYHQNGYLQAMVLDYSAIIDSLKRRADISIVLEEGEVTLVEGISIFGNHAFSDSVLLKLFKVTSGSPLSKSKIEKGILRVLNFYAENGYIEAEAESELNINSDLNRAIVDIVIEENSQYKIGELTIQGLERTRKNVVERELLFEPGQIIDYSKLLNSQRKLYLTGLFKSVFIRPVESLDSNTKNILIEVKELEFREFSINAGYGSVEKARSKIGFSNINIKGTALKFSTSARISYINRMLEANISNPWTFNTPWKTDASLLTEYRREPGYRLYRTGGKLSCGRTIFEKIRAIVFLRVENSRLTDIKTTEILEENNPRLRSFGNTIIRDTRNNLFNATNGTFIEISSEYAGLFFGGTNTFTRVNTRYNRYLPAGRYFVLAIALEIGWMNSRKGGLSNIPLNERFYAGGPNSIRGLKYRMAGPRDISGNPSGGRLKIAANLLELRFGIYKMLGGALFLDIGNVYQAPEDFRISTLRYSPGIGIRLNTPIGLGRLDYGFNPDKQGDEPGGVLCFSIGQAF